MATSTINMTNSGAVSGSGGYCKMGDGTLMQWGSVVVPSGNYTQQISFPQEFADRTKITIQVTPLSGGTVWNVNYSDVTTTGASVGRTPNTSASTYYWLAIGRWK